MLINKEREYHESSEKILGKFVVKYFYSTINNATIERVNDKVRQVQGADVILTIGDREYIIDEKCAIMWRNLDTFSLELTTYNKKHTELITGWFLNDVLLTTHYLCIWINKTDVDERDDSVKYKTQNKIRDISSIKEVDVALVSKDKIKKYLESLGWDAYKLSKKAYNIRYCNDKNFGDIKSNGCRFSYSIGKKNMTEEPINILLPKGKYIELADVYRSIKI